MLDKEGRSTNVIKLKLEWDRSDNEASQNNARAMYSIFNAISANEFRRIAICTSAKEAWDILQVTHEGTNVVKVSKFQILTSRFETIKMEDHENFGKFHAKLMDIVNFSFNLGELIPNSKVVRKILRSFPERFRAKVIAIKESKDVDSLTVDVDPYFSRASLFNRRDSLKVKFYFWKSWSRHLFYFILKGKIEQERKP